LGTTFQNSSLLEFVVLRSFSEGGSLLQTTKNLKSNI
jgi:hypothetical protein